MTVNRRPLRGSWGLGLALLVASTAGAIFVLHARGGPEPSRTAQTPDATYTGIPGSVTCYGTVDLDQGVAPLAPLQPGRVLDVKVKENQVVKKDDILLTLDDQLAQGRYQEALADLNAAKEQLKEAAKLPEQHQLKIEQQQAAVDAMKYRLA